MCMLLRYRRMQRIFRCSPGVGRSRRERKGICILQLHIGGLANNADALAFKVQGLPR